MSDLRNLGLLAYLAVALALAWPAEEGSQALLLRVDTWVYVTATLGLAFLVLTRPPPEAEDKRPTVVALCALSSFYWLGYNLGPATLLVMVFHWLGDAALLFLGRSFAVLPAQRRIVVRGPYRWVRHPVYATYLLADAISVALYPSAQNVIVGTVGAATLLFRIRLEERLLSRAPAYRDYATQARYRVLPGIY